MSNDQKGRCSIEKQLDLDQIIVVLVLYKSLLSHSQTFISLNSAIEQFNKNAVVDLVLYDNSPLPIHNETEKYTNWNIIYVHDGTNPGLSKAANAGYHIGLTLCKKWVLFANPDTSFPSDYFECLSKAIVDNLNIHLFVPVLISNNMIVSPSRFLFKRGSVLSKIEFGIQSFKRKSILFSGMFISTIALCKTGGFNEKIKLDFMDYDFMDKFKKYYPQFFLINSYCHHDLSSFDTDKEKVLTRFKYFCEGGRDYGVTLVDTIQIGLVCFTRAIKLSVRFRDLNFVSIYFKFFFPKNL